MSETHHKAEGSPYDLRISSGGDEFPVSGPRPQLSWKPAGGEAPAGHQLEAQIDGVNQPRVERPPQHLFVEWPWRPLKSGETVRWRVRSLGAEGLSDWADWSSFEVGLLGTDWSARWISPPEPQGLRQGSRPAYSLTGAVEVQGEVASARLYSTALGVYEAFVNSERVGTAELSPGSSSYSDTVYAQAADVTAMLRRGPNTLEVLLSDGWYRGGQGAFREPARWGPTTAARLELHIRYTDGRAETIGTGPEWTSRASQITRADLMDGQTTDFTVDEAAGTSVLVDAVEAPPIIWSPAPPVRVVQHLTPRSVTRLDNGSHVVDFGQNASGWVRLKDLGPIGTRTIIDHGEHLDPTGDLTTTHLDSARPGEPVRRFVQRDEVISSGDPEHVFEPRHTVHGFRYARVSRGDLPLDPSSIVMQVVHSDLRRTGAFECSNTDLNRLHEVATWSFRGNAVDIPTDCPTRERLGWTGDFQVFAPTAARLYDVDGFSRKWLRSVCDDQLDDGRIVNASPDGNRLKAHDDAMRNGITGSSGWGDAIVLVPWVLYETYGDREVLAETWDAMIRWVEWELATARTRRHPSRVERSADPLPHEEFIWDGSFHWGEWLEPKRRAEDGSLIDPVKHDAMAWYTADKGEVGTAYLFRSLQTVAAIAGVLGRTEEAERYATTAGKVRAAWQREFLDSEGRTGDGTQASYVRALAFDLVPAHLRSRAADHLVSLVADADGHLGTGFLSTADLLPVLADTGHADVAYSVLLERTSPSWLGMLDRGATTIWEDWDGVDRDGTATASLNHYSKGAVIRFLHTHTLGLRQAPGSIAWESFVVAPVPGGGLTWAHGSFDGPQGLIEVSWRQDGERMEITVEVPAGSSAQVAFPDGRTVERGPGHWVESHAAAPA